jgi:hypothetical protein
MVVIGNIGTVYTGDSVSEGRREFNECIELSKAPFGRGSGEDVTLFIDGMIDSEYTGSRSLAGVEEGGEIYGIPAMNISQMWGLWCKFNQDPDGSPDFTHFMGRATEGYDCLMIQWCGMWLGVERNGYTHS